MIRRLLLALASLFLATLAARAASPAKPNIVVILVDDMGFSDLGCYGSEIPTPNLDKLAAGGLRFTQFYNTGRCCPTRATLLTGLYAHQTGVGQMVNDAGEAFPGFRGRLNDSCVTLAEVLRPAGYFTIMTGKWHVGQAAGVVPWKRGFDRHLTAAAGGFYQPGHPRAELFLNSEKLPGNDPRLGGNWYSTDLWTDYAIKFIDESRPTGKPFFLYLAHNAPHFPLQAPAADIAKFRGRYKAGWDKLRAERYERQKQIGLIDPKWPLAPRVSEIAAWDSLTPEQQDRFDHMMAVYAACVNHMDRAVGRLVDALRERGVLDNTLILFMSDNGGNAESGPNGRTDGDPTQATSAWYCGESWAHLENTPFRRYKHYNHEGGIATPLIAHWPAGMKTARPREGEMGRYCSEPSHLIDIMPTVAEAGGATYPTNFNGHAIVPMEGRSLMPWIVSPTLPVSPSLRPLFWEHEGNAAVRVGDWKLVRQGRSGPWELYNLKADRTELNNLAASEPARAQELAAKWEAWAVRAHATPNPIDSPDTAKKKAKKKAATKS